MNARPVVPLLPPAVQLREEFPAHPLLQATHSESVRWGLNGREVACDEYGDVVFGCGGSDQLLHHLGADGLGSLRGHRFAQLFDVVVDDDAAPLDEPVGVEAEQEAGR